MLALLVQVDVAVKRLDDTGSLRWGSIAAVDHLLGQFVELPLDLLSLLSQHASADSFRTDAAAEVKVNLCAPGCLARRIVPGRALDYAVISLLVLH